MDSQAAGKDNGSGGQRGGGRYNGRHLSNETEMRNLFSKLDRDQNGYIDKDELRLTMLEVGFALSASDLETMMESAGVGIKDCIFYEGQCQGWGFVLARCSDRLLLYLSVTLLAVCGRTSRRSVIYYILLAAIGAVSGVFAYYPHPGGQV